MKSRLLAFGALTWGAPVLAQAVPDPLAPLPAGTQQQSPPAIRQQPPAAPAIQQSVSALQQPAPIPQQVVPQQAVVIPKDWRGVFDAIDAGNWVSAQAGIAALPQSMLTPVAKAELFTAKGSPVVDLGSLQALIAEAPELPQAEQLAAMAIRRGALTPPAIIAEKPVSSIGSAPYRYKAKPVQGEPYADELRPLLDALVRADDAAGAEAQLISYAPSLSVEARAEAATRTAFIYYVLGQDADARRVADTWRVGSTGEWAGQAAWVSALASWRLGDWNAASTTFQQVAQVAQQRELRAAGYYWAARAEQAAGRPASVANLLRAAANTNEATESFSSRARRLASRPALASIRSLAPTRRSTSFRTCSARLNSPRSESLRWPRRCSGTRPRSAPRLSTMP